jgi:hypothetical protein
MKKLLLLYLAVFFATISFFSGCAKDNPTNIESDSTVQDFIPLPLATGNTWIYQEGLVLDTCSVTGLMQVNNQSLFTLNDDWLWDKDACYYSEGVLYGRQLSDSTTTVIIFPKNPNVGQTWIVDQKTWLLQSKGDQISVGAGAFTCYRVIVREATNSYYIWWANGKGIVKMADSANAWKRELQIVTLN